jgi:hypothetical protein
MAMARDLKALTPSVFKMWSTKIPLYTAARDEDLSSVDETPSSAGIAGIRRQHNQLLFWLVLETNHFG